MVLRAKFYVTGDLLHLIDSAEGDTTWWCVSNDSRPGDLGYIYWKKNGVKIVFEFVEFRGDEQFCKTFRMSTATIRIVKTLDEPIAFQVLKQHRMLNKTVGVRRNFQDRWFDIEPEIIEELQSFVRERNRVSKYYDR